MQQTLLKASLFGTIGALAAVAVTFLIGDAVSGPLMATSPGADAPEPVLIGAALAGTAVGAVAGIGLAALCKRFLAKPAPVFVGICVVGLIAYGAFSFAASETVSAGVWLNVMHIAAAVPIVGALLQTLSPAAAGSPISARATAAA